jgi:hypothetical protein
MSAVLNDKANPDVRMLNEQQAAEFFEKLVRSSLGISAAEFFERYQRGEYKDACDNSRVLKVLMMIPKATGSCDHK